jgi:pyridinium-3,5-biscarboxylic acid mononucleotide sulfurtransferase
MDFKEKLDDLKKKLSNKEKLLIAYSGGVDSSLLAKVATDVLGANAVSVMLDMEAVPRSELHHAIDLARSLELNYRVAKCSLLKKEKFIENPPKRCYLCKKECIKILKGLAEAEGISCIADGVNLSDYKDYRPGIAACDEEGVWHPFVEAEISKDDIRAICKSMNLPFWNRPSAACLASRIPYNEKIVKEKLTMVEKAEEYLKEQGFSQVRVRAHGMIARIEVNKGEMEKVLELGDEIVKELKRIGYQYVTLDLQGFRSGSMNEVLRQ